MGRGAGEKEDRRGRSLKRYRDPSPGRNPEPQRRRSKRSRDASPSTTCLSRRKGTSPCRRRHRHHHRRSGLSRSSRGDDRRSLWLRQRDEESGRRCSYVGDSSDSGSEVSDRAEEARKTVRDILDEFPSFADDLGHPVPMIESSGEGIDICGDSFKAFVKRFKEFSRSQKLTESTSCVYLPPKSVCNLDVQNKGDITPKEPRKDNREEEPPKRRIIRPAMPRPTPSEESPSFTSSVDDVCARISMKLSQVLADHAATERLYAERVRRESEICNLSVESAFCDIDGGNSRSYKARKIAVLASQYIVSLSSFSGEQRIRVCSGFVIRSNSSTNTCKILTSAMLVRSPSGHNSLVPDVRVKVCLPCGNISDGLISMIDFHYNIVMVEVKSDKKLPEAILVHDVVKRGWVLAMGRFYDDGSLMCAQGKIIMEASTFDCSELFMSSCQTTMAGVGGPLVNYSGRVLGINFYGENGTPFLSTAIVLRCLEHWKNYGKIIRPWLGFMSTSPDRMPLRVLEKCPYADKGLYISNVAKGSPADIAGLGVGDILIECAGKVLSTVPEFGALLLDICKEQIETDSRRRKMIVEVVIRKQKDGSTVRKTMAADVLREFNYYRWPAPVPSYNHKTMDRKQFMQFL